LDRWRRKRLEKVNHHLIEEESPPQQDCHMDIDKQCHAHLGVYDLTEPQ